MKGRASDVLIVVVVVVIVAGVAWLRSGRSTPNHGDSAEPAPAVTPENTGVAATAQQHDVDSEPPALAGGPGPASLPAATRAATRLPRVVDLGAGKCKACRDLAPILEQLKKEYAGRAIVQFIDVWEDPEAGESHKIRMIPTQIFFDADGKEVWRHEGFLPKEDFINKLAEMGAK